MAGRKQHSTGIDGRSCCCCSASRASTVNKRGQIILLRVQQKNSLQQVGTVCRRTDGIYSSKFCSCAPRLSKQQQGLVDRKDAESKLSRLTSAHTAISQQPTGLANEAQFQLTAKVKHRRSRGFLIDVCYAIVDAFPDFIHLLYSFQNIFAYSATDISECNLLKCQFSTYPDAKPVRCRPYRLNSEM